MGSSSTATVAAAKERGKHQPGLRSKHGIKKTKTKERNKQSSKSKSKSNAEKNRGDKSVAAAAEEKQEIKAIEWATASQQLSFFINHYQSANGVALSSLELDCLKEKCIAELPAPTQTTKGNLADQVKVVFGSSWKEVLFEKHLRGGEVDPGNPALLVISASALRSLEILRELRSLSTECHAAKLFSKHMKVEEQVAVLKNRVNIASGTPSRIKKLIDIEALGLSRLAVVMLDMHTDVKGYSLLTLPQVRDEFWDLYRSYFHQRLIEGKLQLCLYGPLPTTLPKKKRKHDN
ncbi:uncharacterized protein LOC127242706 [Andrographis paniculata]|uniref:uncharacterized protein LOC127242706 n=1 Tax=Andrographis paniculata TaxID=175694 RepID=UPI0021E72E02|nr:uncharacterized protein LOC127242706 [Andrographis paniculata]